MNVFWGGSEPDAAFQLDWAHDRSPCICASLYQVSLKQCLALCYLLYYWNSNKESFLYPSALQLPIKSCTLTTETCAGSKSNVAVPGTAGHPLRSCFHAMMGQRFTHYREGGFTVVANSWTLSCGSLAIHCVFNILNVLSSWCISLGSRSNFLAH